MDRGTLCKRRRLTILGIFLVQNIEKKPLRSYKLLLHLNEKIHTYQVHPYSNRCQHHLTASQQNLLPLILEACYKRNKKWKRKCKHCIYQWNSSLWKITLNMSVFKKTATRPLMKMSDYYVKL